MWIIVILAGLLNASHGLDKGYSELTDLSHYSFTSREACEAARPEIEKFVVDGMKDHFGDENVIAASACWADLTHSAS